MNTVLVAVRFSGQSSKLATSAASASIVSAVAASRRADCAASAKDSASAPGGATSEGAARGGAEARGVGGAGRASATPCGGCGANRFGAVSPIASSAPIAICHSSKARAPASVRRAPGADGSSEDIEQRD